jgi:hypothetical protein
MQTIGDLAQRYDWTYVLLRVWTRYRTMLPFASQALSLKKCYSRTPPNITSRWLELWFHSKGESRGISW